MSIEVTKPIIEMSEQERVIRFVAKIVAGVIVLFILSVTSCTMHSNTYDAERLAEEAKIEQIEADKAKLRSEVEKQRITAMEKLIAEGKNPVAVRCAFQESLSQQHRESCERIGMVVGKGIQ